MPQTIREQGAEAQIRSRLQNSLAIDRTTQQFWTLMQVLFILQLLFLSILQLFLPLIT